MKVAILPLLPLLLCFLRSSNSTLIITLTDTDLEELGLHFEDLIEECVGPNFVKRLGGKRQDQLYVENFRSPVLFPPGHDNLPDPFPVPDLQINFTTNLLSGFYEHNDTELQGLSTLTDDLVYQNQYLPLILNYTLDIQQIALRGNYNLDVLLNLAELEQIIPIPDLRIDDYLLPIDGSGRFELGVNKFQLNISIYLFNNTIGNIDDVVTSLGLSLDSVLVYYEKLRVSGMELDPGEWSTVGEVMKILINDLWAENRSEYVEIVDTYLESIFLGCPLHEIIDGDFSCTGLVDPPPTTTVMPKTVITTEHFPTTTIASTLVTTPEVTTDIPTTTTTMTPGCPACNATDRHGVRYYACVGTTATNKCPGNSRGTATWFCLSENNFNGTQPDFSKCTSEWLTDLEDIISDGSPINSTTATGLIDSVQQYINDAINPESNVTYFGHEIKSLFQLGENILVLADNTTVSALENLTTVTLNVFRDILTFSGPWEELSTSDTAKTGTAFITACDTSSINLGMRYGELTNLEGYRKPYDSEEFEVLSGIEPIKLNGVGIAFPESFDANKDSFIEIPSNWVDYFPSTQNPFVAFSGLSLTAEYANKLFAANENSFDSEGESSTKILNGKLMSFTFSETNANANFRPVGNPHPRLNLTDGAGVRITFQHEIFAWGNTRADIRRKLHNGERPKAVLGSSLCTYWDTDNMEWSSEGCSLVSSNRDMAVCECNHLTSFAVIMDVHNYIGKDSALEILTFLLSPLSIICLLICIIIFAYDFRSRESKRLIPNHPRNALTFNLCIALLVANILMLTTMDKNYLYLSDGACIAFAIILHYFLLLAFSWMALEGILYTRKLLFVVLRLGLATGYEYVLYERIAAFVVPAIIVGITCAINFGRGDHGYGNDVYCWLDGGYIWSFLAPVAIVITFNITVLVLIITKSRPNRPKAATLSERGDELLIFSAVMGITWIFGFLMTVNHSTFANVAAYIFTLFNASQGILIFVFHVLRKEKIQNQFKLLTTTTQSSTGTYDVTNTITNSTSSNPKLIRFGKSSRK